MKVGIFSGTFDPIHNGHVALIKAALETHVDTVFVMTERKPRRKARVSSYEHRVQMIKLALQDVEGADFLELENEDTFELLSTMRKIQNKIGQDNEVCLMMGADVLEHVHEWGSGKEFDDLLARLRFIVALRTEDDGETTVGLRSALGIEMEMIVSPEPNVSSSKIRERIAQNQPAPIHTYVLQYIQDNRLYAETDNT